MYELDRALGNDQNNAVSLIAQREFENLIQKGQYVGDVYSISYETALVQIHDSFRQDVGGIPSLSFLIATRVNPDVLVDYKTEDASVILLRVMDAAPLPNASEAERVRVESAQRASGTDLNWDSAEFMDGQTHQILSYAGVRCKVIGTFFLDQRLNSDSSEDLVLRFGSDLSNYYPNKGLQVYKPNSKALKCIVNYRDPDQPRQDRNQSVIIGNIRYASTNRSFQDISNVEVEITPFDLLSQKTALFGMTRTGKSNTTKIILQSVFNLRFNTNELRVGQIVFDPNGEYANENIQDANQNNNPSAIKNIWKTNSVGKKEDVVTYGILKHPNDPDRKLMLINFYDDKMLQIGKEIIDVLLASDGSKYIKNFCQVKFEPPDKATYATDGEYYSASTRYKRRVLVYRALLAKAGFSTPKSNAVTKGLFKTEILNVMSNVALGNKNRDKERSIKSAAETLSKESVSWDSLSSAFEGLFYFLDTDEYSAFDTEYIKTSSTGESWADADLSNIVEMFAFTKGANQIGKVSNQHTNDASVDYASEIYGHLKAGRLVIVDQSSGDSEVNQSSAERIMWEIFNENQSLFRQGKDHIPDILVYLEEAHNLLPQGSDMDLKDIWVRTAKEGAKYHLGMVYVTQEVSSIQKNILKNTSNWFIGHLNNTDETKELCKYYDFKDFESSIRRAQDKGFLRVKTLSNPFVIPVQVKRFEVQ